MGFIGPKLDLLDQNWPQTSIAPWGSHKIERKGRFSWGRWQKWWWCADFVIGVGKLPWCHPLGADWNQASDSSRSNGGGEDDDISIKDTSAPQNGWISWKIANGPRPRYRCFRKIWRFCVNYLDSFKTVWSIVTQSGQCWGSPDNNKAVQTVHHMNMKDLYLSFLNVIQTNLANWA